MSCVAVAEDPKLPFLADALRPEEATRVLREAFPARGDFRVVSARLLRHKEGRRCLIEYAIEADGEHFTLLGKIRAKGLDASACELHDALHAAGFHATNADGISVPEAVASVPDFRMWLQRKVPGIPATTLLPGAEGAHVARRLAEAAHKLHHAGVPTRRAHSVAEELSILHFRLPLVARIQPSWRSRIERVLAACTDLGESIRETEARGIHRDFYPDQALIEGRRLWLLDFDLYCAGDPALDVGNCLAHITELSLRMHGDPLALAACESALTQRWLELAGAEHAAALHAWAALSLARHIQISTQFAERRHLTEPLLALCESRLRLSNQ